MKKFLPAGRHGLPKKKLFSFLVILLIAFKLALPYSVLAQAAPTPTPTSVPGTAVGGSWVKDDEVTFVGKVAARSGQFLDWTLANYNWSSVSSGSNNPLATFWATIRNIVYAFFTLFVLVSAFVIIVTRGKNITVMKFIPRFIMILLLVTFSFALIQFIYQITDAIQGFFLKSPTFAGQIISQKDLLFVGFKYEDFQGYRKFGAEFDESVFVSLLLIKLTALTYYVMTGILILRKIILWFFIVISPIFPLLLLYSPIRNTAKIWMGEFFRWLLYAPIFAIFLSGLVHLWSSSTSAISGIPLNFIFNGDQVYPTAISILLGGPGQIVSLTNSVNNRDTFALYVIALLMLWVVIILPFLLLQIFLDFLHDFSFGESTIIKQLIAGGSSLVGRGTAGQPPPPSVQPEGLARPLPFIPAKISIPEIRANEAIINAQAANIRSAQMSSDFLRLANLSIPTMRDIAQYETSLLSSDIGKHQDIARLHETLEGIANPKRVTVPTQRERYNSLQERLKQEAQRGDPLATSILSAAGAVSKTGLKASEIETAKLIEVLQSSSIKNALTQAQQNGDPLAKSILSTMQKGEAGIDDNIKQQLLEAKEKGSALAVSLLEAAGAADLKGFAKASFPAANRVQAVSIDDYESVKKIWQENYLKLEPPKSIEGKQRNRKEWILNDIDKISGTINLLVSSDTQNITKGMEAVGAILPFLLIGGFAQTEVIAYLKAKLEAAKSIIEELGKKEEEESTMLGTQTKREEKPKEMELEEQREIEESENQSKPSSKEDINTNE
ncbi:MAG: hypothetical protein A2958_00810 [Candidatus Levybacteria bacterium RIFCSPLOWO2_01_FULL_38_13]|nr:MAG: hypothetical protein A2629_00705 [Candidatus Levybacteria bacterium RIFCSPHIGHO2_01_FULL_41_15]OGH34828.1 MAG: hypothetical protein A2958_00810 [Candidatus Levybacteria bacterium RIFCSPLOWO2_01_FULL_38_13]